MYPDGLSEDLAVVEVGVDLDLDFAVEAKEDLDVEVGERGIVTR